ncbi:DUF2784 domain-containing protein [Blastococcus deserti]|uniref:DUF2784 domain-containing protein n=1 Tax=Blastococcus deserti TaxID=2259033 RepID=A0ABW4XCB0_9ACTN
MAALVAAELVVAVHMAYLAYMVFGGFLALRWFRWIWPHMLSTVYSIYVTTTSFTCPVTTLEKWLLERGGRTPYEGSFIAEYVRGVLYPAQFETAVWLSGMGLAVFSYVIVLTRRRRRGLARELLLPS